MIKNIKNINQLNKQVNYIIDMLNYIKKLDINKYSSILINIQKSALIDLFMEYDYNIVNINHIILKHSVLFEEEFKELIEFVYKRIDYSELNVLLQPCKRECNSSLHFRDILDSDSILYDIIYRIKVYTGVSMYYNGDDLDLFCKNKVNKLISYIDKHTLLIKQSIRNKSIEIKSL